MKVVISGPRGTAIWPQRFHLYISKSRFPISEIVSGCIGIIDIAAEQWALSHHIAVRKFPPDFLRHHLHAYAVRNTQMAIYADALIAFDDGRDPNTNDLIAKIRQRQKPVKIWRMPGRTTPFLLPAPSADAHKDLPQKKGIVLAFPAKRRLPHDSGRRTGAA
jgi:hypothetical protein